VLAWAKSNWLVTAYAPTGPVIVADPQDRTVDPGESASFVVVAGGSSPVAYQWYFNTNTLIANATNMTLTLTNLQPGDAGAYSVIVSNGVGSVSSAFALLTVGGQLTGFELWRSVNFTPEQMGDPLVSGPGATPAGDGVANLVKYALGLPPFAPVTQPLVGFRFQSGEGVLTYARPVNVPDVVYAVQVSTNLAEWTTNEVAHSMAGTNGAGFQLWEGSYSGLRASTRFFRLLLEQ
jgi:hypothetical protein